MAAKTVTVPEEANGVWGEGDDVFVPTERARSLLSFASLPRTAGGAGGHLPAVNSARVSSMLGSLHPHAGHSESLRGERWGRAERRPPRRTAGGGDNPSARAARRVSVAVAPRRRDPRTPRPRPPLPPPPPLAGSWLTATGHLITAIIGAGVLGLPNAVAWLGWVGGILCIVTFYVVSAVTCTMLTDCYHVKGKRHTRYKWCGGQREAAGAGAPFPGGALRWSRARRPAPTRRPPARPRPQGGAPHYGPPPLCDPGGLPEPQHGADHGRLPDRGRGQHAVSGGRERARAAAPRDPCR
jgi:hypothetical protein